MPQPKITHYSINGSGGAYVSIPATLWCTRFEILEDDAATRQGLTIELPDDNFVQVCSVAATAQPFSRGESPDMASGRRTGVLLGKPQQSNPNGSVQAGVSATIAATTLAKVRSLTATATNVVVREWN